MNPLELYLARVARELRSMPNWKRDEELRELRSHLEQRIEDFQRAGSSMEEAQTRAALALGSPKALGAKLCDAWEGIPFSGWRLMATLGAVTLLWFSSQLGIYFGVLRFIDSPTNHLFPEWISVVAGITLLTPFSCGMLLSLWLGRRGRLLTLTCLPLWSVFFFPVFANLWVVLFDDGFPPPDAINFSIVLAVLSPALAICGSVASYHHRRRRLAFSNGGTISSGGESVRLPRLSPRLWWGVVALSLVLGAGRIFLVLHPLSPQGAMKNWLVLNGTENKETMPPTMLELRELPAQSGAERAGRERRVEFKVEMHVSPETAISRHYALKDALKNPAERARYGEKALRSSLARVGRNSQIVQGTARLVKTWNGWQVDENSFDFSRLRSWVSKVYIEG